MSEVEYVKKELAALKQLQQAIDAFLTSYPSMKQNLEAKEREMAEKWPHGKKDTDEEISMIVDKIIINGPLYRNMVIAQENHKKAVKGNG